ncbi:MAG TPA: hypothetical protein VFX61_06875 [Micromonosporaceae bacterium]|nr:hypothetical protein [Micromonosporaceae bacterium]
MDKVSVHLHGGPLDGTVRPAPVGPDGMPPELTEFDHDAEGGRWYLEYRRDRQGADGWHFQATGIEQKADEE